MRFRTAAALAAALTISAAPAAAAHPRELPDVRASAPWSADVAATWPFEDASTLCRGFRPSDLEAWTITTNVRVGDDLLRYIPSPMPGFLPPMIVSGYPVDVRVWGWCG